MNWSYESYLFCLTSASFISVQRSHLFCPKQTAVATARYSAVRGVEELSASCVYIVSHCGPPQRRPALGQVHRGTCHRAACAASRWAIARSSPHPSALSRPCLRPSERVPARSVPSKPPPGAAAPLEAVLTGRNGPGRARMVANRAGTALTCTVRTGRKSERRDSSLARAETGTRKDGVRTRGTEPAIATVTCHVWV